MRVRLGVSFRHDYGNVVRSVLEVLEKHGEAVEISFIKRASDDLGDTEICDVVLVIGGDGTVLRTLKKLNVPAVGVKVGRLGFFSSYHLDEVEQLVEDLVAGNLREDRRWLLGVESGGETFHAINDAVLQRDVNQKIVDFNVRMEDGSFDYHADGLVVSTPTGSSAYALALGGPIMLPNVEAFEVTPMAPQFLATRSLVVPSSERLRILASEPVNLVVDGDVVSRGREFNVFKSERTIVLLRPPHYDFSTSIREKIGYGRRYFNNDEPGKGSQSTPRGDEQHDVAS